MSIKKILIAEDDMIIQMFLSKIINNAGFRVVGEARNYIEILKLVDKTQPDLIVMDIGLEGEKDGIETARFLNKKNNIPILFITGNSDKATMDRANEVEPIGIIFKPIDEYSLIDTLIKINREHSKHK
jgi:AmiR/NasT family two-component response regulator